MKKKGYIAGSLFKTADQKQRIYEKEVLSKEVGSIDWFNPLTDNPSNDKSKLPTANNIFVNDTSVIIDSEYIVAELDGEDAGVMMELGIAYGINFILDTLSVLISEKGLSIEDAVLAVFSMVPVKTIYAHLSDIRLGTAGEYDGKYIPVGFNQYVVGGVEQIGEIFNNFEDIVEELKKKENN